MAPGKPPAKAERGRLLVQPKEPPHAGARGASLGVIKPLWGYRKTRYQGLEKNAVPVYTLLARAHFYRARQSLTAGPGSVCPGATVGGAPGSEPPLFSPYRLE